MEIVSFLTWIGALSKLNRLSQMIANLLGQNRSSYRKNTNELFMNISSSQHKLYNTWKWQNLKKKYCQTYFSPSNFMIYKWRRPYKFLTYKINWWQYYSFWEEKINTWAIIRYNIEFKTIKLEFSTLNNRLTVLKD